jgi:hypothetical protein
MMSYRHLFGLGFIAIMGSETSVISAESLPKGMDNVEKLAGCFNVTYRFVEDGVHDLFSKKYALDKPHKEWIGFKRGEKDTLSYNMPHFMMIKPLPISMKCGSIIPARKLGPKKFGVKPMGMKGERCGTSVQPPGR